MTSLEISKLIEYNNYYIDNFRVRMFDMRTESMTNQFAGHSSQINTVQMDDMKVVSGGDDGFVRVWDLRMSKKLWEIHNRYLEW
jgi:F-box/WD-40 domain protein 8